MRNPVALARSETSALIAEGLTVRAALAAEIARSRELTWQARALLLAPYPFIRPIRGGADLESPALIAAVLSKLSAGSLPATCPAKVWAGESRGVVCDACDRPIAPRTIEYEVDITSHDVFRFHGRCFDTWIRERAWYREHTGSRNAESAESPLGTR